MMPSIRAIHKNNPVRIICLYWRTFPPGAALQDEPAEKLWKEGKLKQDAWQQYEIWKRICNHTKMNALECLNCDNVRLMEERNYLPVMVSLDGTKIIPTSDIPTAEASPRNRRNCIRQIRPKHSWAESGRKDPDKDG